MDKLVWLDQSTVIIPTDRLDAAYRAVCALNASDEGKHGGSHRPVPPSVPSGSTSVSRNANKWFIDLDWNYDETCDTLEEILAQLGFTCHLNNKGLVVQGYQGSEGDEWIIFSALAPFVTSTDESTPMMRWSDEVWRCWWWVFERGQMLRLVSQDDNQTEAS